jgi:hypothetical protein
MINDEECDYIFENILIIILFLKLSDEIIFLSSSLR